jgi:hypothetical protein
MTMDRRSNRPGEAEEISGKSREAPMLTEPRGILVGTQGPEITRIGKIKIFMDFQK